jgi:aromatic ring-opening dioxygenase catalytic subunit (LigB family)
VSSLQPPRAARRPAAVIRTVAISITLSSPPTLCERRHRDLSRDLIAVRRRAILVMSEGECPHPLRSDWRRCCFRDAANDDAIGQHVEVVVALLAGWAGKRSAFEDQLVKVPMYSTQSAKVLALGDRRQSPLK